MAGSDSALDGLREAFGDQKSLNSGQYPLPLRRTLA